MFKKRIVFLLFFLTGLFLVIFPLVNKGTPPKVSFKENVKKEVSVATVKIVPSPTPTLAPLIQVKTSVSTPTPESTSVSVVSPTSTPTPAPTQAPTQTSATQTLQVNLSVNGGESLTVNVDQGNNQCDVLTKALGQGKINSLNMRYDNNLGTYAVYQINGIGKENSVWWTYKVNGVSPSQGCSYIKVNNGDKIEWNYLGS